MEVVIVVVLFCFHFIVICEYLLSEDELRWCHRFYDATLPYNDFGLMESYPEGEGSYSPSP